MDIGRRLVADFIGTFAIVFVGVGAISVPSPSGSLLSVALAFGFVVAVMVSATLHISGGQFNPAVSLALLATGKMPARDTILYVLTQLAGATVAAFLCGMVFGEKAVADGTPVLTNLGNGAGIVMELILTFLLVFVIFGVAVDKRGPNVMAGLLIGLTVTLDILFGGPYTGASMNPARSFGPALIGQRWDAWWVYWIGPIIGGVLAGLIYNFVFLVPVRTVTVNTTTTATRATTDPAARV